MKKNLIYYSTNADLQKPEAENESTPVGEIHTATVVIADVHDEDLAKKIVEQANMHDDLIDLLELFKRTRDNLVGQNPLNYKKCFDKAEELLSQAKQINNQPMNTKTHQVVDLTYLEDEGQGCLVGTQQECNNFVSQQNTYGLQVVPLTKKEIEAHKQLDQIKVSRKQ